MSVATAKRAVQAHGAAVVGLTSLDDVDGDALPAADARVAAQEYTAAHLDRASQIVALLDAAGKLDAERRGRCGHGRALIATLTFAGLRISEALDLCWADVDLARGTITVRASKTDAGVRVVDILAPLRDALLELKTRRPAEREALVFATRAGRQENASNVRTRILGKAVEAANKALVKAGEEPISERLTPHGLRHSFASLLVALGEDPSYVMGLARPYRCRLHARRLREIHEASGR